MDQDDDHVYLSLVEGDGDGRWAFGTGFEDPLMGVDPTVPEGVDTSELAALCVELGDDALVAAQRLAEWTTRAPELEEEVALANIGLDLLGQARLLYSRAGQVDGTGRDEDAFAYARGPEEFRNLLLVEQPRGDFAHCVTGLLLHSTWRLALMQRLRTHPDPVLAAVAAKAVPELSYHRDHAAQWVLRLGDGTEESRRRMLAALGKLWPYLGELHAAAPELREEVEDVLRQVLRAATLPEPQATPVTTSGRRGEHGEHLAPLLEELQSVARTHPGATW
ncbi:1,2-phenylacetyl-CoA epoxidase subunit PaaC [Streptacidiphilus monticola]|uniref:1,2-phenylacetyl-CoA epoxidase subunit PaaC n=1 Tax=Streptacidiphilus monticola TaxID=2161674 RepID=A0ABW1FYU7_9ACTN